jgi:ribosomal protein S18 acetylase RimI-like enzyme
MVWLRKLVDFMFNSYSCYLYENSLIKRNEADFLPGISNLSFEIVSTKQHVHELQSNGFDMSKFDKQALSMLEQGAVVGVLFVDKELASMEWVAMNKQANRAINIYPIKIDYSIKEAYASGVWTKPKFRRRGLHTYVYYKVYDFLRQNGITVVRSIVAIDNKAAQRAHAKFAPQEKIYAKVHFWKVMWMQFWKEERLDQLHRAGLLNPVISVPEE